MTVTYYVGNIIRGLSSDTKPTNVPTGSIFVETDTGDIYALVAGVWVKSNTFVASDIEVYPYSTTIGDYTFSGFTATSSSTRADDAPSTVNFDTAGGFTSTIGNGNFSTKQGERITDTAQRGKKLKSATFYLRKLGSPTGTLTCTLRKTSDNSIIETSADTIDVSTLTTSYVARTFNFNSMTPIEDFRIMCEYSGGDVSNRVEIEFNVTSTYAGGQQTYYNGAYNDISAQDTRGSMTISVAYVAAQAIDGDNTKWFESTSEVGPSLKLELSASADKEPVALALMTHANTTATQLKIEVSDDNSTWSQVRLVNVNLLTHGSYNYFRFNRGTKAYRYVKITGTDGGAKVLAVNDVRALIPTESQLNRRHGHKAIATNDGTVALNA